MKNKELHEFIHALSAGEAETPLFQQRLKRAVLARGRQQSLSGRLQSTFANMRYGSMSQHKKSIGLGTFALLAIMFLSIGTYSLRYSPKAVAEQAIDQGLLSISAQTPAKLLALQAQFGGNPADALKEAQQAKDVKIITKAEFQDESRHAPGIFATSLDSKTGAVGTPSPSGMTFMSTKTADGSMGSATVSSSAVAVGGGESGSVTSAEDGSGPTFTTSAAGNAPTLSSGQLTKVNADGSVTVTGTATTEATASGTTTTAPAPGISEGSGPVLLATPIAAVSDGSGPVTFNGESAVTYLRYTDHKGHVVVLSLDKNGLPIFKTIFMTQAEAAQLRH